MWTETTTDVVVIIIIVVVMSDTGCIYTMREKPQKMTDCHVDVVCSASVSLHVCGRKMPRRLQLTKENGRLGQKVSRRQGCSGETLAVLMFTIYLTLRL